MSYYNLISVFVLRCRVKQMFRCHSNSDIHLLWETYLLFFFTFYSEVVWGFFVCTLGRRLLVPWACRHCWDTVACISLWAANCSDSGLILCAANVIKILAWHCFKRFAPIRFSLACTEKLKARLWWKKKYWIILCNQIKAYTLSVDYLIITALSRTTEPACG